MAKYAIFQATYANNCNMRERLKQSRWDGYKVEFIRTNITTQEREKEKENFAEFIICKIIVELEANLSYSLLTIAQCPLETNSTLKFKQKIKCFILVIFLNNL